MKRQLFTLLLAVCLLTVMPTAQATNPLDKADTTEFTATTGSAEDAIDNPPVLNAPVLNSTKSGGVTVGGFVVEGGDLDVDFRLNNSTGVLYINTSTPLTISNLNNSATQNRISVSNGVQANITFAGVNIETPSNSALAVFEDSSANITLAEGSVNRFVATDSSKAGIKIELNATLTIDGKGSLEAVGGRYAAGIGSDNNVDCGNITINGGTVTAIGSDSAAGIGGGRGGSVVGTITINGGVVTAIRGSGAVADIGAGEGRYESHGTFTTGVNGNAFIYGSIGHRGNIDYWNAFMFDNRISGVTHGNPIVLTDNVELPVGKTLDVNTGWAFTVSDGVTFTNNGTINNHGTITVNGTMTGSGTLTGNGSFLTEKFTESNVIDIPDQVYTGFEVHPQITFKGQPTIMGKVFSFTTSGWNKEYTGTDSIGQATVTLSKDGETPIIKSFNIISGSGDFDVVNGVLGEHYIFDNGALVILKVDNSITISNKNSSKSTNHTILVKATVKSGVIALGDLNIDVQETFDACAFSVESGAYADIYLIGGTTLKSGENRAGLEVPVGATVDISGGGTLTATGGTYGAGIGGGRGYGDGYWNKGDAGTITINEGTVTAIANSQAAGIGGGHGGIGGNVTISDGVVTATTVAPGDYSAIGGWFGDKGGPGTFSTGSFGDPFIITTNAIADQKNKAQWSGIIFEGDEGYVYGNVTLPGDRTIPSGKTLTIGEGTSLTVPKDITLTNNGILKKLGALSISGYLEGRNIFGDATGNHKVDIDDLNVIADSTNYNTQVSSGEYYGNPDADINGDGKINFADLAMARNNKYFGK